MSVHEITDSEVLDERLRTTRQRGQRRLVVRRAIALTVATLAIVAVALPTLVLNGPSSDSVLAGLRVPDSYATACANEPHVCHWQRTRSGPRFVEAIATFPRRTRGCLLSSDSWSSGRHLHVLLWRNGPRRRASACRNRKWRQPSPGPGATWQPRRTRLVRLGDSLVRHAELRRSLRRARGTTWWVRIHPRGRFPHERVTARSPSGTDGQYSTWNPRRAGEHLGDIARLLRLAGRWPVI